MAKYKTTVEAVKIHEKDDGTTKMCVVFEDQIGGKDTAWYGQGSDKQIRYCHVVCNYLGVDYDILNKSRLIDIKKPVVVEVSEDEYRSLSVVLPPRKEKKELAPELVKTESVSDPWENTTNTQDAPF